MASFSPVVPTGSCRAAGFTVLGTCNGVNFLWFLFIFLFEPIFISALLTKILLFYTFVFPMLKFKLFGSMYMPMPTEKSTFDNACSNTP